MPVHIKIPVTTVREKMEGLHYCISCQLFLELNWNTESLTGPEPYAVNDVSLTMR